ncbi:MAG TPA: hypothetical protein ENG59_03000 [Chloroflexi bacterium]|nr:MAG: hypothetical protein DRI46_03995 [Chloroflexota bacterium]HDD55194.1 hypothetical protein [Chloroflexota bacterium]
MDLNVFNGTVEELQAFLGIDEPQPVPVPEPSEPTGLKLAKKEIAELKKRASTVILAAQALEEIV